MHVKEDFAAPPGSVRYVHKLQPYLILNRNFLGKQYGIKDDGAPQLWRGPWEHLSCKLIGTFDFRSTPSGPLMDNVLMWWVVSLEVSPMFLQRAVGSSTFFGQLAFALSPRSFNLTRGFYALRLSLNLPSILCSAFSLIPRIINTTSFCVLEACQS